MHWYALPGEIDPDCDYNAFRRYYERVKQYRDVSFVADLSHYVDIVVDNASYQSIRQVSLSIGHVCVTYDTTYHVLHARDAYASPIVYDKVLHSAMSRIVCNDACTVVVEMIGGNALVTAYCPCGEHSFLLDGFLLDVLIVEGSVLLVAEYRLYVYKLPLCPHQHEETLVEQPSTLYANGVTNTKRLQDKEGMLCVVQYADARLLVTMCTMDKDGTLVAHPTLPNVPSMSLKHVYADSTSVAVCGMTYDGQGGVCHVWRDGTLHTTFLGILVDYYYAVDDLELLFYKADDHMSVVQAQLYSRTIWTMHWFPILSDHMARRLTKDLLLVGSQFNGNLVLLDVRLGRIVWKYSIYQLWKSLDHADMFPFDLHALWTLGKDGLVFCIPRNASKDGNMCKMLMFPRVKQ